MSYQVTIEPIGTTIEVEEDQTVLDAALRQGVWLPLPVVMALADMQGSSHRRFL
jgi:hypothetical protein